MNKLEHIGIAVKNLEESNKLFAKLLGKPHYKIEDVEEFEKQMRKKVHYVIKPQFLWSNITELARTQNPDLLKTLEKGFRYIEDYSFDDSFQGLFSEINLNSEKLGKSEPERNKKLGQNKLNCCHLCFITRPCPIQSFI